MMNRRGFLTALLGTSAAAVLLADTSFAFPAVPAVAAPESVVLPTDYAAIHKIAADMFHEELDRLGCSVQFMTTERKMLGEKLHGDVQLRHQFSVDADLFHPDAARTAMKVLAQRCAHDGVDSFASLPVALLGTEYAASRMGLRMVAQYSVYDDLVMVRFDTIGGSSPRGARLVAQRKIHDTKRMIRRRLGSYPPASRLTA